MSAWTKVTGVIRVDGLPGIDAKDTIENLKNWLGPIADLNEFNWENCKMPCGSEGSLQYKIIEYGKGMPWTIIPIWGDLRDYESINEIISWWKTLLKTSFDIRDAVLSITDNNQNVTILKME